MKKLIYDERVGCVAVYEGPDKLNCLSLDPRCFIFYRGFTSTATMSQLADARRELAEQQAASDEIKTWMQNLYDRTQTVCFHCREMVPAGDGTNHVLKCPKHPMREIERQLAFTRQANTRLRKTEVWMRRALKEYGCHKDHCGYVDCHGPNDAGERLPECTCGFDAALAGEKSDCVNC